MKTPKIIRPTRLEVSIPEDLRARLDLYLYSEVENRVPFGAYQKFFVERMKEFFSEKRKYLSEAECSAVKELIQHTLGYSQLPDETKLTLRQLVEKI
jgi:uncharacterized protein YcgL (UPF0745 family)